MTVRFIIVLVALLAAQLCSAASKVVAVTIDGVIHPITREILAKAIDKARDEKAEALLVRLNTPGGMLDATREIVQTLVSSPVPIITYVTPSGGRAASAGFFLLQAGDVAAMNEGTNTGAASPVLLGGEMDKVMRRKVEEDTSALLRSIVSRRGRNVEMAEKAVLEAKSFTETEALENKLIDTVSPNEAQLLDSLHGKEITRFNGSKAVLNTRDAEILEYQRSMRENIISAIANPNIAFILLMLGLLGIYIEFNAPGLIVPGVLGGICVLLALSALSVFPINWIGVALIVLALAFFVLEAVVTSHGILGIGGAVAMTLGAMLLIDGPPQIRIRLSTAIAVSLPFALITIFLVTLVVRSRENKVISGIEGLINEIAVARTPLDPAGKVFVHGEYWDAVSTQPVPEGAKVRVVAVHGLKVEVEPILKS
ncbi:MAG: NfeD family protein [Bryobacteraceae bacterium]